MTERGSSGPGQVEDTAQQDAAAPRSVQPSRTRAASERLPVGSRNPLAVGTPSAAMGSIPPRARSAQLPVGAGSAVTLLFEDTIVFDQRVASLARWRIALGCETPAGTGHERRPVADVANAGDKRPEHRIPVMDAALQARTTLLGAAPSLEAIAFRVSMIRSPLSASSR